MKFTIHLDKNPFNRKPTGGEIGGIKNRLHEAHGGKSQTQITIEQLAFAIQHGYTIQPCVTFSEDDLSSLSLDKDGNQRHDKDGNPIYKQKYTFISQQLILADIDNEGKDKLRLPDGEYMTLDRIGEIFQENDLAGAIVYHSFSSKPEWGKFRVGILLDEPLTDKLERDKCVLAFFKLFGTSIDKKCTNIDRIFFGSKPNSVLFDDGCTVSKQTLLQLYDKLFMPELDAQATLDGNQSEITAAKPLNSLSMVATAPTHTGGIDKALSPDFKPEDLLLMIDVNALDYAEWFSVTSAYKGYGGNREIWVQWNAGWNGKKGKGTNRSADVSSWNGANGTPTKRTLIYFAKLHSPAKFQDYVEAMNPYSPKFQANSEHTANSSINKHQQAREKHQKYVSPYDTDGTGRLTIVNLQAYMKTKGFSVAYDEILRENVFGTVDGESKLHLPETMPTIIKDDLQGELKGVNRDNICAMLDLIASRNIVNPIRSMIEGTKWDGIDRLKQFYDLFEIPETDTLSRVLIRKWAMQCICGLYNQYEHPFSLDIILVFQGKQGIAKTRFFEHLAMMPEYFKESAVLDPANKDSIIECTGVWIAELGEIGSTMRKDIDRMKGFLTQSTDTYRLPYGRKALKYPRRTSFVGTVNDEKFLLDTTGNRRFASVPLQLTHTLDYETQIKAFDALQFWAQILQIVRDAIKQGGTYGGCFRLDETEKANLETRNSSLLKLLPFEQEFLDTIQHYTMKKAEHPNSVEWRFCTLTEWLTENRYRMGNCSAVQLGKILAKNGYTRTQKKKNGVPLYGYSLPVDLPQKVS